MHTETALAMLGLHPEKNQGIVNPPLYRASTILFETLADFEAAERGTFPGSVYARYGTATSQALEEAIAKLEGADLSIVTPSGLSAIVTALMAFTGQGGHVLVTDTAYGPTRRFCDQELKRFGVETTYYDPAIGAGIGELIRGDTRVVFVESPGSCSFEMQDIPAIAKEAHARGAVVIADNTWATPLFIRPFELGIDVSIHSATKYIAGHSDLVMGVLSCKQPHAATISRFWRNSGASPGSDNCWLALRGLRTMAVRLRQHQETGIAIAQWLARRPEVTTVLHPAIPGAPGHDLWKRDFTGACGLFSFVIKPVRQEALAAMLNDMQLFGMGYSWGGYESLLIPLDLSKIRTASAWPYQGQLLRLHAGLEHADDLIRDLEQGFERMKKSS